MKCGYNMANDRPGEEGMTVVQRVKGCGYNVTIRERPGKEGLNVVWAFHV